MNRKHILLRTGALAGIATLALAHHVPVGLSHVSGQEILQRVVFFTEPGSFGVPAYDVGDVEAPGHHAAVGLVAGDSFSVMDQSGTKETIVFEESDFEDISTAVMHDVVHVINEKATLLRALDTNGYCAMEGLVGGSASSLQLSEGPNGPLSKMGFLGRAQRVQGSNSLELTLSIPDPDLDLAGRPYLVFVSSQDGSFSYQGHTIPVGRGRPLGALAKGSLIGRGIGGPRGELDATSDATLSVSAEQLEAAFGGHYPDELYFAFVAFGPANEVAYVSNRFTVDFR